MGNPACIGLDQPMDAMTLRGGGGGGGGGGIMDKLVSLF